MKKILSLVLALCLLCGMICAVAEGEVPTVTWYAVGSGMPANYEAWQAAVNAYIEPIIGCHLDYQCIGWGDWGDRRSVIINSGENFDIMFGAGAGDQARDVNKGAFQPIDELLEEYGQGLLELIPADYFKATSVNGKIYGVPTYKDSSITEYFLWDKGLLAELGLTEDAMAAHTLEEVSPILYAMKEYMEEKTGTTFNPINLAGELPAYKWLYEGVGFGLGAISVRYDDEEAKVVETYRAEDIMAEQQLMRQWYLDGIINPDAATLASVPAYNACYLAQGWSTAAETSWATGHGDAGCLAVQFDTITILSTESVLGSVNYIGANSANPDKAMAVLNLVNTDTKFRDMLYFGLEGDNFDYIDGRVHKNNSDWTFAGYTQGTFFNVSLQDTDVVDQWAEVKELNASAVPHVLLGFGFDPTNVADQIDNCSQIFEKYGAELKTGTIDPETAINAMYDEMYAAGLQEIIDEAQAQIDAFLGK